MHLLKLNYCLGVDLSLLSDCFAPPPPGISEKATEVRLGPRCCPPLLKLAFSASSASFSALLTFKMDDISVKPEMPVVAVELVVMLVRLILLPSCALWPFPFSSNLGR